MIDKVKGMVLKNINIWKLWIFFCTLLFIAYVQFLNPYITCDHIGAALFQTEAKMDWEMLRAAFSGGRYGSIVMSFFSVVFAKFNISHYQNIYMIQIFGIMVYGVCCCVLYNMFSAFFEGKKQKTLLGGMILLAFVNPFMVETYLYGAFDFAFGIMIAVFAAKRLFYKKYVSGFFLAFWAVSTYQTNIFITMIIALAACFMSNVDKPKCKMYIDSLVVGGLTGGAAVINVLIFKVYEVSGNEINAGKAPDISENYGKLIWDIISQIKSIYVGMFGTYPVRFVALFVIFVCLGTMVFLGVKKKYYNMVIWPVAIGVLFTLPFAYMIVANSVWCTQRTLLSVFFAIAMFLIGTMFWIRESRNVYNIFLVACIVFSGVTFYSTQTLITDCYIGQALDYSEALCIEDEIREYEEMTGIEVDTISWYKTSDMEYEHQLLRMHYGNLCSHRIICDAGDYLVDLVSEKEYNLLWMTEEEYNRYFSDENWTVFNPSQQLHFEDNILYWAVY